MSRVQWLRVERLCVQWLRTALATCMLLSAVGWTAKLGAQQMVGGTVAAGALAAEHDNACLNRRYDRVAVLTTHNAMSNAEAGWLFPNQTHGIARQLKDGVRGLMLDVHAIDGKPFLVHSYSLLGRQRLADGLGEIKAFMDASPRAIVTILFESHVNAALIKAAFDQAGLSAQVHVQDRAQPWPRQSAMVRAGRRLVVFTDRGGGEWPGFHEVWEFCQETHYAVREVDGFNFKRNRGRESNPLLILNHFLTAPVASKVLAEKANASDVLLARALRCEHATKRFPKFVTVDFYEGGAARETVVRLNRREAKRLGASSRPTPSR